MGDTALNRVSTSGLGTIVGTAASASASNAVLVDVNGIRVTARVATGLTVAAGNLVLIARFRSVYFVHSVVPAAPTVDPTPPAPDDSVPVHDSGDAPPDPKPTVTTGTLVCPPVATSTWRDGKWRTDIGSSTSADTFQGRYSGSGFGRNTGFAFYGSKPRSLSGSTVTHASVKLRRLAAGDSAARTPTLRLVTQSTRPGSFPTLNETASGPGLSVGSTTTSFAIPTSWAQAMVDGDRGGLAISVGSDTPYIRLAGKASWSAAWTLTISWRRSS